MNITTDPNLLRTKSGAGRPFPSSTSGDNTSNKKQKTSTEFKDDEEAKNWLRLSEFFEKGEFPFDTVLNILQQYPNLATGRFCYHHNSGSGRASILSLALLLCRNSEPSIKNNLDSMVKAIYDLSPPESINHPGLKRVDVVVGEEEDQWENDWSMFPLYQACRGRFSDEIIDFLAENYYNYLSAMMIQDNKDSVVVPPTFLFREFSLSKIRRLLERCPSLFLLGGDEHQGKNDDEEEEEEEEEDQEDLYRICGRDLLMDLNETGHSPESYASILQSLPKKEISFYNPLTTYNESDRTLLKKVLNVLPVDRLIVKMSHPRSADIQFIRSILVQGNEEEEDGNKGSSIPSLHIEYSTQEEHYTSLDDSTDRDVFELVLSLLEWNGLHDLMVRHRTSLSYYRHPSSIYVAENYLLRLCEVLGNEATKLKSLTFDPPCIKTPKPMQAFAKVLQNKNITLQYHSVMDEDKLGKYPSYKKAIYYTELNKYGRRLEGSSRCVLKVQDPLFPITEFVSLLASVKKNCKGKKGEKKLCHQVQYELLRQSPGLWSPYGASY